MDGAKQGKVGPMTLIRATIPMCPECGAEMTLIPESVVWYECGTCENGEYYPHWGYHAPDVASVVAEMREYWDADVDPGPWLKKWIDRLEGKHE